MKKFLVATIVLSVFTLVSLSTTAETTEKDKGYVSVSESTIKEVVPNQAEISIGIETSDTSLQKASDNNKTIANKVVTVLKSQLNKDDYIKTNTYSARPEYVFTKDNKRVFDKYVVNNTVTIKTNKIELVSKLIDSAIAQGATSVENLQFLATDYDCACNAALGELTKKAYSQAYSVAKSINSDITGIKSINATCNPDNGPRPYYAMMAKSSMDSVSATPIESGKLKINVNVDASFYVK